MPSCSSDRPSSASDMTMPSVWMPRILAGLRVDHFAGVLVLVDVARADQPEHDLLPFLDVGRARHDRDALRRRRTPR